MTQQIDPPRLSPDPLPTEPPSAPVNRRSWWRRPWTGPLAIVVIVPLLYIWPHYIGLDRSQATTSLPPNHPLKYPILVGHILFGSIALVTAGLQVWPRLRRRRPALHRAIGRVYVFGGVLPGAILATILLTWLGGPGWIGRITLGVLWVFFTASGYLAARRRRWEDHRKFMIYSFALTLDAFSNRLLSFSLLTFVGPQHLDITATLEAISWIGWLFNLLVAHWFVTRTAKSRRRVSLAA